MALPAAKETNPEKMLTYEDYASMPDDGRRYELYDGEVRVVPAPFPLHQLVSIKLARLFHEFAEASGGLALPTPIDVVFNEFNAVQPDILFFQASRRNLVSLREVIRVPPDIVIEILSPSTARHDRGKKLQAYLRFGVPEYWIVDPQLKKITVLALQQAKYHVHGEFKPGQKATSVLLKGFELDVSEVLAGLDQ